MTERVSDERLRELAATSDVWVAELDIAALNAAGFDIVRRAPAPAAPQGVDEAIRAFGTITTALALEKVGGDASLLEVWKARRADVFAAIAAHVASEREAARQDAEILDWLEHNHTLHRSVTALYVVDGYEVSIEHDASTIAGSWRGKTLREAYVAAIRSRKDTTNG
jgi:hypothetical protein